LHKHHEQFLKKLIPTFDFDKNPVKFPVVQRQPNCNDCGVFAIAFATSLLFNIKPDKVKYEHKLMRSHLIRILETNVIEHFSQDLQYGVTQKVFPLAVINAREAEALRIRMIRQHETEQQKLNRLGKCLNIYHTKKELYKIQPTLQSTTKNIQLSQNVSKEINNTIQIEQNNDNKCSQEKDRHLYSENLQYIQNISNKIIQVSGNNTRTE